MADQQVSLTVSDPITATIREGFATAKSIFDFLCTPEGQLTVKEWRENSAAFRDGAKKAEEFIVNLFTGKL